VHGDVVEFSFPGKSGQEQSASVRDRQVAHVVRALLKLPGHEVFKFLDDDGRVVDVTRQHINQYIKCVMGEQFSAKDFRTWGGTLVTASTLARASSSGPRLDKVDPRTRKKRVVEAVKETAEILGNTPAVSRSSYIAPSVLSNFDKGKTAEKFFESVDELAEREVGMDASEKAVVSLLKRKG
jgi:DNA topoisomerase-1